MPQFDIYKLPRDFLPFTHAVNVQSDLVTGLPTRACLPLAPSAKVHPPATRLNPTIQFDGETMFVMTQHIEALPVEMLKRPVGSVGVERFALTSALDFLFQGY
jgi:toxin CcdB